MNVWWGVFHIDSKTLKLYVSYSGILVLDKLYTYIKVRVISSAAF